MKHLKKNDENKVLFKENAVTSTWLGRIQRLAAAYRNVSSQTVAPPQGPSASLPEAQPL